MIFSRKKFYREVLCQYCKGKGLFEWLRVKERKEDGSIDVDSSKIEWCPLCDGRGTQTVLEREE